MSYKQKQTARLFICILVTAFISVLLTILFMTNNSNGEKPLPPDKSEPDTSQGSDTSEPDKSQGGISEPDKSQGDTSEPETPKPPAELTWDQVSQYLDGNEVSEYVYYSPNYENNNIPVFVINRLPDNSVRIIVSGNYQVSGGNDYTTQDDDAGETFKVTAFIDKIRTVG